MASFSLNKILLKSRRDFFSFNIMSTPSTRYKHVRIRTRRRKSSWKKRSRRGKHRKRTKKSTRAVRALITSNILKQNTRLNQTSIGRIGQVTIEKMSKNQTKQKLSRTKVPDQQNQSNLRSKENYLRKNNVDPTYHCFSAQRSSGKVRYFHRDFAISLSIYRCL